MRTPFIFRKRKVWTTKDLIRVIVDKVETEEDAEAFFEAYSQVCPDAEYNISYYIGLVHDKEVQEDLFDLFLIEPHSGPARFDFGGNSCLGIKS